MKPSVPGLILVAVGVLFLLRNFGINLHLGELFATWWPAVLIAVGIGMMVGRKPRG
ncbi:LiaI-LiaF-like domain-containing protein [Frateuria defendens]|uniref:LiaI-LiaF-like domain-containing protein n=1 Tax=Frateuria defendens TaxID=2219559 RepID=UPI00066FCD75|nr:DUF5668 domain-containing protein [Frateuria defendens]